LATGAQDIHNPVHDRAHVRSPLATARFRWRNERLDMPLLVISNVTRISQVITIVFRSVLIRPHRRPLLESDTFLESQPIRKIQEVLGRTLRTARRAASSSIEQII
jgi:hypothetical protein